MSKFGDDCHYFYNSTCTRGSACQFRHCEASRNATLTCTFWQQNRCNEPSCPFRHSGVKAGQPLRIRDEMPCFWEGQPGGCTRPNCMYKHLIPRPRLPVQPMIRPQNPTSMAVTGASGGNIITLVDVTTDRQPPRLPLPPATYPMYLPDMSVPPPNMPRMGIGPVIKPVIVNTAEDSSDIESPYSSPIKKSGQRPVEWKDVAPARVIRNLTQIEEDKPATQPKTELKEQSGLGFKTEHETKEPAAHSQTKSESVNKPKPTSETSECKSASKPGKNGINQTVESKNTAKLKSQNFKSGPSLATCKKVVQTEKNTADTSKSFVGNKPKGKIIRTQLRSVRKSSTTTVRPSPEGEKRRKFSASESRTFSGVLRRRSESGRPKRLEVIPGKPKIISLKKPTKSKELEKKVASDDSDEDLGIKSLEQTLRERALRSMGIIELKSGRIVRTNVKKRCSTDKKEHVVSKKTRKLQEMKTSTKKEKQKKVETDSESDMAEDMLSSDENAQSSEEGGEIENNAESSDENASVEENKSDDDDGVEEEDDDDELEEEEEIELGEADPDDMKVKGAEEEESEAERETSEHEESEQPSSAEEDEPLPIKKKKSMIVMATDTRKAVVKSGKSSLKNFTIKKTVPLQPVDKKKIVDNFTVRKVVSQSADVSAEKPKRKRRVILEDDDIKPAPVISVVKPSVKNRLGIVLSQPGREKPITALSTSKPAEPSKIDSSAKVKVKSAEVKASSEAKAGLAEEQMKPKKNVSNVWSRRAWNSREDRVEGRTKPLLEGIRSRLGQTLEQENTQPSKKRLGWKRAGSSALLKDDKAATDSGDAEDDVTSGSTKLDTKKATKRPMQIYVPPALKRAAVELSIEKESSLLKQSALSNVAKESKGKPEKKNSVKTFAQIMAEKQERRKHIKQSAGVRSSPPNKSYTQIRFDTDAEDKDAAPKKSASVTDSFTSSYPTTTLSSSDTDISKPSQGADKLSRWRRKARVKNGDGSLSESASYNQDSVQSNCITSVKSSSSSANSGTSFSSSYTDCIQHDSGSGLATEDSAKVPIASQDTICNPTQSVTEQNTVTPLPDMEQMTPEPSSQNLQEEQSITPAKRAEHSSSDNWLDLDVDDLDLDLNISSGETKDEDLLREIDELLA